MTHRARPTLAIALSCSLFGLLSSGCDVDPEFPAPLAQEHANELALEELRLAHEPEWPEPAPLAAAEGLTLDAPAPGPATSPAQGWLTFETFHFSANEDWLSVGAPPDILFAPTPEGIQVFPPELEDGFLLGFQFRDLDDQVVGFGSEQELLDFETESGSTVYTLTIPDRGTIVFRQEETFDWLFDAVDEMVADQVMVRSFDPPIVEISTIPGTGRIIGGSGEFANAKGFAREISIVNQLDLVTRKHDVATVLQLAYF